MLALVAVFIALVGVLRAAKNTGCFVFARHPHARTHTHTPAAASQPRPPIPTTQRACLAPLLLSFCSPAPPHACRAAPVLHAQQWGRPWRLKLASLPCPPLSLLHYQITHKPKAGACAPGFSHRKLRKDAHTAPRQGADVRKVPYTLSVTKPPHSACALGRTLSTHALPHTNAALFHTRPAAATTLSLPFDDRSIARAQWLGNFRFHAPLFFFFFRRADKQRPPAHRHPSFRSLLQHFLSKVKYTCQATESRER